MLIRYQNNDMHIETEIRSKKWNSSHKFSVIEEILFKNLN